MWGRIRVAILAGTFAALLIGVLHGCASSDGTLAPTQDASMDADAYAASDSSLNPAADSGASALDAWVPYPDYDPACGFFVPADGVKVPPIRWETCRSNSETAGKTCREMVADWKPNPLNNELITPNTVAIRRTSGGIALMTARFQADQTIRFVADVDGEVLVAVAETNASRCVLGFERSDGEHYVFHVLDSEAKGELSDFGGGALGGALSNARPTVLKHYHDAISRSYVAGEPGLIELANNTLSLTPWTGATTTTTIPTVDAEGALAQNYPFFSKAALFWASDTSAINKEKVWTQSDGAKDLLSFGADSSKGVADLGTDGESLVWVEGSQRASSSGVFPKVVVATSPFTTDPLKIVRRELRSDISGFGFGTSPFVVGCGFAARSSFVSKDGGVVGGTLLVRLADGYAWQLPDKPGIEWGWRTPLALTCDELFVLVAAKPSPTTPPRSTIVRVRLDSLGVPLPP